MPGFKQCTESRLRSENDAAMFHMVRELGPRDAYALAKIQVENFPNTTLSLLGERLLAEVYQNLLGFRGGIYLGVECAGRLVGIVCGGDAGAEREMIKSILKRLRWKVLLQACRKPFMVIALFKPSSAHPQVASNETVSSKDPPVPIDCLDAPIFRLKFLAISGEENRNKGYGRELLDAFEQHARNNGAKSILLGVLATNHAARRLYVSQGMSRVRVKNPSPPLIYYGKRLDGVDVSPENGDTLKLE